MKVIGVIPARMGSTRLPGKPLKDICGKPMVWWVYRQAVQAAGLEEVLIATDAEEIYKVCRKYQMPAVLTSNSHPTAIHRLWEVSQVYPAEFYIQINGDEPLIQSAVIEAVIPKEDLRAAGIWGINAITEIEDPVEAMDPANIKMVFNERRICTYMSRTPIPYPYRALDWKYYKHVGVIGYTPEMLEFYVHSKPGKMEQIEGIDLLRFVEYEKDLYLTEVKNFGSLSVDTQKDLDEVRKRIRE